MNGIFLVHISVFECVGVIAQMQVMSDISEINMQQIRSLISAVKVRDENLTGHSLHARRKSSS